MGSCWEGGGGGGGQGKCAHLQASDDASGISSCYNGFPGSYPVTRGMTHGKLLGLTSLLCRQENRVRMASGKCEVTEGPQSPEWQCQLPG